MGNFKNRRWIIAVAISLFISVSAHQAGLYFLDFWLIDFKFRTSFDTKISGSVELIGIDAKTRSSLKGIVGLDDVTKLIDRLSVAETKSVALLLDLDKLPRSDNSLTVLQQSLKKHAEVISGLQIVPLKNELEKHQYPGALSAIRVFPATYTTDTTTWAEDDVSRRTLIWYQGYQQLWPYYASKITGKDWSEYRGQFDQLTSKQVHTDFRRPGTFKIHSMIDVIDGKVPIETFRNKLILVGNITTEIEDNLKTPFSRNRYDMSMLEVKANNIETLISDTSLLHSPKWLNIIITALVALLTSVIVLRMRPAKGIAYLVGLTAVFWLISWGLFALFRYNLESAHPLLVIAFSYYFFIPYRLIKEARASWEYQQKNKLLMQVEELKTNFISMMSHDLKTPLARIQGMADIVLEDDSKLNDEQVKAAKTIRKSTEELSNLVTSILDLGRIESQNVKLNLHSKDVNQIVNDVCNRCSHYAADKDIQLVTELEPLFSIKIDEHLISQVISNLVENAIKYSPNGTKVMVSTDEMDNKVVIQVSDQGPGIPEEDIGNIFMKFYRSKAAKSSPIKGSGLGLYLAKYFVELHKGSLTVDSVPGQGTTFTVELPNHQ